MQHNTHTQKSSFILMIFSYSSLIFFLNNSNMILGKKTTTTTPRNIYGNNNNNNNNGNIINKERLLKNAVPYNNIKKQQGGRQLEENQEEEENTYYYGGGDSNMFDYFDEKYGQNQIDDGKYSQIDIYPKNSIKFRSCMNVETENNNLLLDNLIDYTKKDALSSIKSYVLFDLCKSDDCTEGRDNTFMVDLYTYIQATVDYGPAERQKTCDACNKYQDTCYDYYNNNNYGRRHDRNLDQFSQTNCTYVIFDEDTCEKCNEYGCWNSNNNNNDGDDTNYEEIENLILQYTECTLTDSQWNDFNLYAGWTCKEDGTGIEIGLFIDQYCKIHQTELDFETYGTQQQGGDNDDNNLEEEDIMNTLEQSQGVIDMMFNTQILCQDDDWYYLDFDSAVAMVQGDCVAFEDDISEACGMLFYSDFIPRKTSNCGNPQNITKVLYQSGDYDYVEYNQARQDLYSRLGERHVKWYDFDLSAEDSLDGASTCEAVISKYERVTGFNSMERGIWKFLAFAAGVLVGFVGAIYLGMYLAKKRNLVQVQKDGGAEESMKKLPSTSREYHAMEDAWAPPQEPQRSLSSRSHNTSLSYNNNASTDYYQQQESEASSSSSSDEETEELSRALKIKKSLSRVKSFVKSKSFKKQPSDEEEFETEDSVVIIDATGAHGIRYIGGV